MRKQYIVINKLIERGVLSADVADKAVSLLLESGKPSLFHLIKDCSGNPDGVADVLNSLGQVDGTCICPKCDGSGSMLFGKGDGACHLCERSGAVALEVAFEWLDNNRCILGFSL